MPVRDNPTLGQTICSECEEPATVHQQSRGAGRYLYTRGCDCKYRNSTGKIFQTRLWLETDWLGEIEPIKPPNVQVLNEPISDSNEQEGSCSESIQEDDNSKGWLAAGITILVGVALAIVTGGRKLP